jgi:hypothetical protein
MERGMYKKAIAVLNSKCESIRRVCESYAFSRCSETAKLDYISQLGDLEAAIAALNAKSPAPTNNTRSAPCICACGDHIDLTGDYAVLDGKPVCSICMRW